MIFWWLAWAYTCIFVKLLWSWISQQGCTGSQARIAMAMVNVCDCSSTLWSILMYPIQSSKYYLSLRHSESVQVMIPQRILLDFYCWSWRDHAYIHIYTQKDVYVALLMLKVCWTDLIMLDALLISSSDLDTRCPPGIFSLDIACCSGNNIQGLIPAEVSRVKIKALTSKSHDKMPTIIEVSNRSMSPKTRKKHSVRSTAQSQWNRAYWSVSPVFCTLSVSQKGPKSIRYCFSRQFE